MGNVFPKNEISVELPRELSVFRRINQMAFGIFLSLTTRLFTDIVCLLSNPDIIVTNYTGVRTTTIFKYVSIIPIPMFQVHPLPFWLYRVVYRIPICQCIRKNLPDTMIVLGELNVTHFEDTLYHPLIRNGY